MLGGFIVVSTLRFKIINPLQIIIIIIMLLIIWILMMRI